MNNNKTSKKRIKIRDIEDLKKALLEKNIILQSYNELNLKEIFLKDFNIDTNVFNKIYCSIKEGLITYKVEDINDFIDYIKNIIIFEDEHKKLCEKLNKIKILKIDRVEYDRIPSIQDDVEHILKIVDYIKEAISAEIDDEGKLKLNSLEHEVDRDYVYAKDIELLKKIIIYNNNNIKEEYDESSQTKTLLIEVPNNINFDYIKAENGSVEYYQHIKSYIPRMKRLIRNIDKYIEVEEINGVFKINQSTAIQDSVNMAIAVFNNQEFRAVSGKNDIKNSCKLVSLEEAVFESCKVNKLGKLGIGYNRVNDSEKKIFEYINKKIEDKELNPEGNLTLYTKWQPCPSCYYVISQFINKYPKIDIKVKYYKEYGEIEKYKKN